MSDTNLIDATADSSTATESATGNLSPETDVNSNSSNETQTDVNAESSTEIAPEKQFSDTIERLESGKAPKEAVKATKEATEAKTDEPAKEATKETNALSQEHEEALNKQFVERPEWKAVLNATPKEKQKDVRQAMRTIYERENALHKQVEQTKPVLQKFERFKRGVGNEEAVDNTITLIELWQKGDPKAKEMLMVLVNDLDARTGAVLTSPDLKQRNQAIDEALQQGTMDEAEAAQRRNDLLELQKARVTKQQTEKELQSRESMTQQQRFEAMQQEMETSANEWEKDKIASDPDYPSLKKLVEASAFRIGNERQNKLNGQRLLNGAEIKQIFDEALKEVKAEAEKWKPKPKARTVLNGNGSSANSRRQPANPQEAFFQRIEELEARGGRR